MIKIDRTRNAVRNIISGLLVRLYLTIIPFFMKRIIIQSIGVEYIGLDSLFVSILQVLNLAELGVGSAMVFSMYKPIADNDTKQLGALLNLYKNYYRWIGIIISVIGICLIPFLPKLVHGNTPDDVNLYAIYLISLCSTVCSYWFFSYRASILLAYQRVDLINIVQIIAFTIRFALQAISIIIFKNYYFYSLVLIISQLLINLFTLRFTRKYYPEIVLINELSCDKKKDIKSRIKAVFTSKLGGVIINSADTIVISSFIGLKVLGIYQNYMYVIMAVFGFYIILMDSCVAGIGNSLVTETKEKNYIDFMGLSFATNWICAICISCLINMFQCFISLWVGDTLQLDFGFVILFAVFFLQYTITNYWCVYKNAAGIWQQDRFRPLIGAVLNLFLNLLFVKKYGLYAILLSTIVSYVIVIMPWLIVNLFKHIFVWKNLKKYLLGFFSQVVIILLSTVLSFQICSLFGETTLCDLIIRFAVSSLIPGVLFGIVFCKTKEFRYCILLMKKVLKKQR